jgi:hypothetical protein
VDDAESLLAALLVVDRPDVELPLRPPPAPLDDADDDVADDTAITDPAADPHQDEPWEEPCEEPWEEPWEDTLEEPLEEQRSVAPSAVVPERDEPVSRPLRSIETVSGAAPLPPHPWPPLTSIPGSSIGLEWLLLEPEGLESSSLFELPGAVAAVPAATDDAKVGNGAANKSPPTDVGARLGLRTSKEKTMSESVESTSWWRLSSWFWSWRAWMACFFRWRHSCADRLFASRLAVFFASEAS